MMCPNCAQSVVGHADNQCVLNAFIQLLRERENLNEARLLQLHGNCSVDTMWDDLGPILDKLEAGEYSPELAG